MSKDKAAPAPAKAEPSKAIQQNDAGALVQSETVPSYLQNAQGNRGAENVTHDDLVIPRLEMVQDLSPARKESDPNYIPGAREGMLYNNVSRELYGTEVVVVPIFYMLQFLLWKDRKKGGGFGGAYNSKQEAEDAISELIENESERKDWEVVDTGQMFGYLVKGNGKIEEIVISMARTKAKIRRAWNSLIKMQGADSFARAYKLKVAEETNNRSQKYYNFSKPSVFGYPSESTYRAAEKLYAKIKEGKVKASEDFETDADPGNDTEM